MSEPAWMEAARADGFDMDGSYWDGDGLTVAGRAQLELLRERWS